MTRKLTLVLALVCASILASCVSCQSAGAACGNAYQPMCCNGLAPGRCSSGTCNAPYQVTQGGYCMEAPDPVAAGLGCGGEFQPPCPPGVYAHVPVTGFPMLPLTSDGCIQSPVLPNMQFVLAPADLKVNGTCQDVCIPCGLDRHPVCPGAGATACTFGITATNPDGNNVPDPLRPGYCAAQSQVTCGLEGLPACNAPLVVWDDDQDGCMDESAAVNGTCVLCNPDICPPAAPVCEPFVTTPAMSWWINLLSKQANVSVPALGDCVPCGNDGQPACDPGDNPDPRFADGCYYFTLPDPTEPRRCLKHACGGHFQQPCPNLPVNYNPAGSGCLYYHTLVSHTQTPVCVLCQSFAQDIYDELQAIAGDNATTDIYTRCDDFQYGCGYASHTLQSKVYPLMLNPVIDNICILPGTQYEFGADDQTKLTWPNYWGCKTDCRQLGEQCNDPSWIQPLCCLGLGVCRPTNGTDPNSISICKSQCEMFQAAGGDIACHKDQCGGTDLLGNPWTGSTQCELSTVCTYFSPTFSQCLGIGESALPAPPPPPPPAQLPSPDELNATMVLDNSCRALTQQCGGANWNGPTCCQGLGKCAQSSDFSWLCTSTCSALQTEGEDIACLYDQCGGAFWRGSRDCEPGTICKVMSYFYSQCRFADPVVDAYATNNAGLSSSTVSPSSSSTCTGTIELNAQCGGAGWRGDNCCKGDGVCAGVNHTYSGCYSPCENLKSRGLDQNQQCLYDQCGGAGYTGATECEPSTFCTAKNASWSECRPAGYVFPALPAASPPSQACALVGQQCGAAGPWDGPTCCQGFAECLPDQSDSNMSYCASTCYARRVTSNSHKYLCLSERCSAAVAAGATCEPGTTCLLDSTQTLTCQYPPTAV